MRWIGTWVMTAAVLGACGGSPSTTMTALGTTAAPRPTQARPTTTTSPATTTVTTGTEATVVTGVVRPATTAPPTAAPATVASTTALARLEPIVLRPDGLGAAGGIGDPADAVVSAIAARLGAPTSDESMQFTSEPTANGWFTTPDEEYGFSAPVARTVCWLRELCVAFGGLDAITLTMRGWRYAMPETDGIGVLTTASGLTVGRRWSEFFTEITAPPGGCYSIGYGRTTDGIAVQLRGGSWSRFGEDGSYEELLPDPIEVIVTELSVGDHVVHLYEDC